MIPYEPARAADRLPVIELGASDDFSPATCERAAAEVRTAARDTGFFYVIDHGIDAAMLEGQLGLAAAFFGQPIEAKLAIDVAQSPIFRGYERIGLQTLDEGSPPDLKESLMLGIDLGSEHPLVAAGTPLEGRNQWPQRVPGFDTQVNAYLDALVTLGRRLAGLLALSLELPENYFDEPLAQPNCALRMLRYPAQQSVIDNRMGCGAHTDWGFITMLLQDDIGGLEVQNAAGDWFHAPPIPGSFVINLGDMVPTITNGRYRSSPHRVVNAHADRDRHSIAAFFNPAYHTRFACAETCLDEGQDPPAPVSYGEHLSRMFERSYGAAVV